MLLAPSPQENKVFLMNMEEPRIWEQEMPLSPRFCLTCPPASTEGTPGSQGALPFPVDGLGRWVLPGPSPVPRSPSVSLLHLPCPPSLAGAGRSVQLYLADLLFLIFNICSPSYEKLEIYLQSSLHLASLPAPPAPHFFSFISDRHQVTSS